MDKETHANSLEAHQANLAQKNAQTATLEYNQAQEVGFKEQLALALDGKAGSPEVEEAIATLWKRYPHKYGQYLETFKKSELGPMKAFYTKGISMIGDTDKLNTFVLNAIDSGTLPEKLEAQLKGMTKDQRVNFVKANAAEMAPNAYAAMVGDPKKKKTGFGNVNPSDFTAESMEKYKQTGNYSDLVRYESPSQQATGLKTQYEIQALADKKIADDKAKLLKQKELKQVNTLKRIEAEGAIQNIDSLIELGEDGLGDIYGAMEGFFPDALRWQGNRDNQIKRDQISSTLQLAAAGKLKGQGTITDPERKLLSDAASVLGNEEIGPKAALAELNRIRPIFQKMLEAANNPEETVTPEVGTTSKEGVNYADGTTGEINGIPVVWKNGTWVRQ